MDERDREIEKRLGNAIGCLYVPEELKKRMLERLDEEFGKEGMRETQEKKQVDNQNKLVTCLLKRNIFHIADESDDIDSP